MSPILRTSLLTLLISSPLQQVLAHGKETHQAGKALPVFEQTDWGIAGLPDHAHRTVELTLTDDMRILPEHLEVQEGETVHLKISNAGSMLHEWVLGTTKALDDHAKLMMKFPNMEHSEPYMAHVPAGESADLYWTFNRSGDFGFACLIAGHYQAGMKGTLTVSSTSAKAVMGEMHAMTGAEVRKIDREAGKITLKHGEILHMGMPPMTMVFRVKDLAILEGIAEGDKVEFDVIQDQGQMVITQIRKAP